MYEDIGPHAECPSCHGTGECSNAQFRCHCRWHRAGCAIIYGRGDCDCRGQMITGGSQAPEAEALLKGQPHEAKADISEPSEWDLNDQAVVEARQRIEGGGSDTARLQQEDGDVFALARFLMKPYPASYRVFCTALDAQAQALRTVREERDKWQALALGCSEAHTSLRADVERLTAWKEEALQALAQSNVLHEVLKDRPQYLGWNVHKAAVHALSHAEQQVRALRASIEQLQRHRYMLRIDAGLRVEEMFVVWDEVKALVSAAIKET